MRKLKIDPEFRDKVPPLTEDERKTLEENILKDGRVLVPLIAWNGIIIDGHNRYAIVQKHPEIPYDVVDREFPDKWAAIAWMCKNQLGRRNLSEEQKSYLRGKQYEAEKMSVGSFHGNQHVFADGQNVHDQTRKEQRAGTAGRIGKEYGVDGRTIRRDEKFAKGVDEAEKESPGFKEKILSGKIGVPKTVVSAIPAMPKEERKKLIQQIENGEIKKLDSDRKRKSILGGESVSKEKDIGKAVDSAVNDIYDTDREVTHTAHDIEQELLMIVDDFVKKINRTLQIRESSLKETETKEMVISVLLKAENNIKKIRSDLT